MQSNSYSVPGDDRLDGCSLFSFGDELTVFTKTAAPRARERFLKVLRFHQSCAAQPFMDRRSDRRTTRKIKRRPHDCYI
jgi:hypothetical protein